MRILVLLLLLTSCASEPLYYRITRTTYQCPKDYIYNARTELCHYFKVSNDNPVNDKPSTVKRLKKESESSKCVKAIHKAMQCGVSI